MGGGNLISFTISGTQYQAEEGMTWGEWVNSKYNVINATIYWTYGDVGFVVVGAQLGSPILVSDLDGYFVISTQEIITNYNYTPAGGGAGGGS